MTGGLADGSSPWVKVKDMYHGEYYWNTTTDECRWSQPEGEDIMYVASRVPSMPDYWYYWHVGTLESVWNLPGSGKEASSDFPFTCSAGSADAAAGRGLPTGWSGSMQSSPASEREWKFSIARRGALVPLKPPAPSTMSDSNACTEDPEDFNDPPYMNWIQPGAAMCVASNRVPRYERYSGQAGTVYTVTGSLVQLQLPDQLGAPKISIPARLLEPLPVGTIVQLLKSDDYFTRAFDHRGSTGMKANLSDDIGTICTREELAQAKGEDSEDAGVFLVGAQEQEYCVRMSDNSVRVVGLCKVVPRCRVWSLELPGQPPGQGPVRASASFQWRKEQKCTFVESGGHQKEFQIQFPKDFESWRQKRPEDRVPWPVLFFLHGAGGGGFSAVSKKALKSLGVNYIQTKCIIVSPLCDWTWKDSPKPWVTELITTLRAADFVDHRRIYLTGCSMGGMGVWEVGAARPDLFAAIAPVAAHHQVAKTQSIAHRLRDMPIFICHSGSDGTCQLKLEAPLWNALRTLNQRIQVNLVRDVDHCSMFERAYCDDTCLYDWLLLHRSDTRPCPSLDR